MSEEERVHETVSGISKDAQMVTQSKMSNDQVEEQIQVDRKRLESMITGSFTYHIAFHCNRPILTFIWCVDFS